MGRGSQFDDFGGWAVGGVDQSGFESQSGLDYLGEKKPRPKSGLAK